jgi:hypothetical protein
VQFEVQLEMHWDGLVRHTDNSGTSKTACRREQAGATPALSNGCNSTPCIIIHRVMHTRFEWSCSDIQCPQAAECLATMAAAKQNVGAAVGLQHC